MTATTTGHTTVTTTTTAVAFPHISVRANTALSNLTNATSNTSITTSLTTAVLHVNMYSKSSLIMFIVILFYFHRQIFIFTRKARMTKINVVHDSFTSFCKIISFYLILLHFI